MPLPVLVGSNNATGNFTSPGPTTSYTSLGGTTLILTGTVNTGATAITGITGITDTAGNTWQYSTSNSNNPPSNVENNGGGYICSFIAWCFNAAAITSVTVHDGTGNSDYWQTAISEWQNLAAFDTGNAAGGATAGPTSAPVTPSMAGVLLVGAGNSVSASTVARPTGWTGFNTSNVVAYQITNTTGTQSPGWSFTGTPTDWTTAVAAFRPVTPTSIAEDPSTPATITQTADTTGSTTTASFTPPANSMLVAMYNVSYASGTGAAGLTISDSAGGTWNLAPGTAVHNSEIWWRNAGPSPSALTVTVSDSLNGAGHVAGRQLSVRVLTGAAAAIGYAANGVASAAFGTTFSNTLGAQAAGSVFYACGTALTGETLTALPGTTTISDFHDTTDVKELFTGKATYPSLIQGYPVMISWGGTSSTSWAVAMLEVLPSNAPAEGNTIWGQATNIATAVTADTGAYTLGTVFEALENGTLTGVWFWSGSGAIALPTRVGLWSTTTSTSILLDAENANWSGPVGSGWIRTALSNPQPLTAGTYYAVGVFYGGGSNWYTGSSHWWDTNTNAGYVGIPFGPAIAPDSSVANANTHAAGQSAFVSGGTDVQFPTSSFNAGNYWIDPEITIATPGAPYVVQELRVEGGYSGSFMKNITPGNSVIMMVTGLGTSVAPVTSAPLIGGATVPGAVKIGELSGSNATQFVSSALWLLPNLPGGNTTASITIANDTPTANSGLLCWEVAGLGNVPSVDVSSTGSANSTSISSGTTSGVAGPGEFVVGMWGANGVSYNEPTWFTSQLGVLGCTVAGWQVTTSAGTTYSYTGIQPTADAWSSIVAAIQPRSNGLVLPDQVPAIYQQRIR